MHYLGIDIGGTSIKAGLVDETGRVLESRRALTITDDLDRFLLTLTELVRDFQKSSSIVAVGLGVPGLHSSKTDTIKTSPNIPCLKEVNLTERLANAIRIRTVTENDANAAAYAEFICGAGVGVQHMVCLTLGTGLGSGIVLNGALLAGASGYAGEFGHTTLSVTLPGSNIGRLCGCGKRGCVEAFVSAAGIVVTAEEKMKENPDSILHKIEMPLTSEKIYDAAIQGDVTAHAVFMETGRYLGIACANLINLLNLDAIVIGGGVMASGDLLLKTTRQTAAWYAFPAAFADCQIVQSKLWPDAGVVGAAMLARDR
jgi:glucokinase